MKLQELLDKIGNLYSKVDKLDTQLTIVRDDVRDILSELEDFPENADDVEPFEKDEKDGGLGE
jgi:hypothetical protein